MGAHIDGLLNSYFERPLEIFLAGCYTEVFFSVCHALVAVLILIGENRLPGHFLFLLLKPQTRCYNCFSFDVSRNGGSMGTPHLLFREQLQCFAFFFILGGFPFYYGWPKSKIAFY